MLFFSHPQFVQNQINGMHRQFYHMKQCTDGAQIPQSPDILSPPTNNQQSTARPILSLITDTKNK